MEGNYALRLIKRADYCALTSLDTRPKIIGLDSIPTAVGYRIEDKEELESST